MLTRGRPPLPPPFPPTRRPGTPAVLRREAVSPSAYQQALDGGAEPPRPAASSAVRHWSDFARVHLHPRSAVQVHEADLGPAARPLDRFAAGADLFAALDGNHDLVDRDWRPFVEECDAMQGVQVVATLDDAWGGFASSYLEALRDEHPKSCIWFWALRAPPLPRDSPRQRLANAAQALSRSCLLASVVVPLAVPDAPPLSALGLERASPWHVSGLLSTAMESAALPSRLAAAPGGRPASLADLADGLNISGRQTLVGARMAVGDPALAPKADMLDLGSLHPGGDDDPGIRGRVFGQVVTRRGRVSRDDSVVGGASGSAPRPLVGKPIVRRQANSCIPPSHAARADLPRSYTSSLMFPLLSSFPSLYRDAPAEQAISVRTSLTTDSTVSARVRMLQPQGLRSVAPEEREALGNSLMDIADAYQDGWSSGSDEGDDDL